jgi:hypothetical protein
VQLGELVGDGCSRRWGRRGSLDRQLIYEGHAECPEDGRDIGSEGHEVQVGLVVDSAAVKDRTAMTVLSAVALAASPSTPNIKTAPTRDLAWL